MISSFLRANVLRIVYTFLFIGFLTGCSGDSDGDDTDQALAPRNLQVTTEIKGADGQNPAGDGSGEVTFQATAENAVRYTIRYDGKESVMTNGSYTMVFDDPGTNTYDVEVKAFNSANASISKAVSVQVLREYEIPEALLTFLTGDDKKEWRIKNETTGHLGVGPKDSRFPEFYEAQPLEKFLTSMYDDVFILEADQDFTHDTKSFVFGKAEPLTDDFGSIPDTPNGDDEYENYPLEAYSGTWSYSESNGRPRIHMSDNGFFGFYVGGDHVFEIMNQTETTMTLKTVGFDDNGWFVILTSEGDGEIPEDPVYNNLIFEDDFRVNGEPDESKWGYDIGRGDNGWGNAEAQYYTDRSENVVVENDNLKIIAQKENFQGASYTSARLKTQDKFDFTYGRLDVRAKLPKGGGTWPAIWMLGANFPEVGWPNCGEIDIMEHVGNDPGSIQSALHNPSSFGNTIYKRSVDITDESDTFHVYSMIWSEEQISFYLDGVRFYIYRPESRNSNTWPYDKPQFLILNVAMGGSLGGDIDPTFTSSSMEIDYVRIYQ
jgi:hypothetical protein